MQDMKVTDQNCTTWKHRTGKTNTRNACV